MTDESEPCDALSACALPPLSDSWAWDDQFPITSGGVPEIYDEDSGTWVRVRATEVQ